MVIYRMEDLYIKLRIGRSEPTGQYEKTRIGTRRMITKYVNTYKTNVGEFYPEQWIDIAKRCVEASNSKELLDRIIEHCRTHCTWLKTDKDREEYALAILVGRVYHHWKEFSVDGLIEKTAFIFVF